MGTLFLGCQSFEPIQTETPTPGVDANTDSVRSTMGRPVEVQLATGETRLPEPISELRFRIPRMALITRDSSRTVRELPQITVKIIRGQTNTYTLLRSNFDPEAYDQLKLTIRDIYVEYGPNAGAPLTVETDEVEVSMPAPASPSTPLILRLTLDGVASFDRSFDRTWVFTPTFDAELLESGSAARTR